MVSTDGFMSAANNISWLKGGDRFNISDIKRNPFPRGSEKYKAWSQGFDQYIKRKVDKKYKPEFEETSVLESLEKEMGDTDEFFELNQVGVKTIHDSFEIGTDEYRTHCQMMTPGQPILSFKLANKVIERNDIDLFADEDEIIDKYKKRYGDSWKDELEKAIQRMKKEL